MSYAGAVESRTTQPLAPQEAGAPTPTGSLEGRAVHRNVCDFIADLAQRIVRLWDAIVNFVVGLFSQSKPVEEWNHYLQNSCEKVDFNDDPNKIRLFFLGDTHTDPQQIPVRERIIHHYAFAGGEGINRVFTEGLDKDFPQKIESRDFIVESWEDVEHFEESSRVINKIAALLKEASEGLAQAKEAQEKRPILARVRAVMEQHDAAHKRHLELDNVRNHDLIQKVLTALRQNPAEKVFVIAGDKHVEAVSDAFKETSRAVLIPKTSEQGQQNTEQFMKNLIAGGNYDEAYAGLI